MKRLLGGLTAAMLLGVFATAQEPAKEAPAAAAPKPGAPFFERFDLNKDGKVDWEEYQKVKSGFATLDADHDGAITEGDMAKIVERNLQRMRKTMRRRMMRHFGGGDMRRGPGMGGGFGPQSQERQGVAPWGGPGMGRGGFGPGPGQQGSEGRRGPMGPGGQGKPCPMCGQQRGGGMRWGFGAPEGGAPPDAPVPPPPPGR